MFCEIPKVCLYCMQWLKVQLARLKMRSQVSKNHAAIMNLQIHGLDKPFEIFFFSPRSGTHLPSPTISKNIITDNLIKLIKVKVAKVRIMRFLAPSSYLVEVYLTCSLLTFQASKHAETKPLLDWAASIRNHFWHCVKSCDGDRINLKVSQ